jgi:hypothetical protein
VHLTGQYQTQLGFVRALRLAFKTHDQFRWDDDPQKSKIHIHDAFPLQGLRYPAIIITISGGPALMRGIGDEVAESTSTEITLEGSSYSQVATISFSGQLAPSVVLDVRARSSYERAQIIDWCLFYIRHFFTDKFTREGVLIQDIQMGPQTQSLLGTDSVFGASLSIRCLTSWQRDVPVAAVNTLNALCLTGVFTTLPNGVTLTESSS